MATKNRFWYFLKEYLNCIFAFPEKNLIMKILDLEFKPYIDRSEILLKVRKMAESINFDYKDKDPLFLSILNGSFIFTADLLREINIQSQISFIKLSSYSQVTSTGKVKELIGLNDNVFNRNLIIIEDIIDFLYYLYIIVWIK